VSRGEIGDKFGDHNFAIATPKIGDQDLAGAGSEGAATAWIMSARKTIAATVSVLLPRSAVAANITGTSTRRYLPPSSPIRPPWPGNAPSPKAPPPLPPPAMTGSALLGTTRSSRHRNRQRGHHPRHRRRSVEPHPHSQEEIAADFGVSARHKINARFGG